MKPEPSPGAGGRASPLIEKDCEKAPASLLPPASFTLSVTVSVNVAVRRSSVGVTTTLLPATVNVPVEVLPELVVSTIVPVAETTSVAGSTGLENEMVNVLTVRSYDAPTTCGAEQSKRNDTSSAGESEPSEPTTRTRATWYPDCPLNGYVKLNLPFASALPVRTSVPASMRRRANAGA